MTKRTAVPQTPGDPAATADAPTENVADAPLDSPKPAKSALPDQSDVNPAEIPYGQSVLTNQGHVCSSQRDPRINAQR